MMRKTCGAMVVDWLWWVVYQLIRGIGRSGTREPQDGEREVYQFIYPSVSTCSPMRAYMYQITFAELPHIPYFKDYVTDPLGISAH